MVILLERYSRARCCSFWLLSALWTAFTKKKQKKNMMENDQKKE
jgi:hypothetical protein